MLGAACALVTLAAGCEGGVAPTRGFGSRQLLATRDPTFALAGEWNDDTLLASTMTDADGGTYSYVSISLATGQVQDLGPSIPNPPPLIDGGVSPITCEVDSSSTGKSVLIITDTRSGQVTRIEGIANLECPSVDKLTITVSLIDDAGIFTLWTGPYDHLARVATDLVIHEILPVRLDGAPWMVLASPVAGPSGLGLYAIDKVTFASTEVIAPALGPAAYADGAPPGAALASDGLSDTFPILDVGDHFLYGRVMTGGQIMAFVGPFVGPLVGGAARELALYPPQVPLNYASVGQGLYHGDLPAFVDTHETGDVLWYWDDTQRRLVSCSSLPRGALSLSGSVTDDGRHLLFSVQGQPGYTVAGPLLLVSLDLAAQGSACALLAAGDVTAADFSPDGAAMFWVSQQPMSDATLWSAAADGSAPRSVGASASIAKVHFIDGTRLELALGGDLVWLDLQEASPTLHYIAEGVFGDSIDLFRFVPGSDVLITGYQYNPQDASGMLGVIDRVTGMKRPISPAVVWYQLVALHALPGDTLPSAGVAYFVRGRHPSAQDGLWLATLAPGDLR